MVEKNNKNIDDELFESKKDSIPVQKVYTYKYKRCGKDGVTEYTQNIIAPVYTKKIPNHIHYLNKTLDSLILSSIQLNKIRRLLHTIIRCEVYGKSNMMVQVNRAKNDGELSDEMSKLMKLVFKKEGKVASDMRKTLTFCLEVVENEENEIKRIDDELKKLDAGDLD